MKGQNQNFEKVIRPVFTDPVRNALVIYWNMKSAISQYVETPCSVETSYTHCSVHGMENLTSRDHFNISVESLKISYT